MKRSITIVAMSLLLGAGTFTATAAQPKDHHTKKDKQVSVIPLRAKAGFAVMVDKPQSGKSMVIVYDDQGNSFFKDELTDGMKNEKKYLLTNLDNGNYTVEVFSKNHDVKTNFTIYNKGGRKMMHMQ